MIGSRNEIARLQSDFYRDQFRKMVHRLIVCVAIIFLLIVTIIGFIVFQPPAKYYGNTIEGRILQMPPAYS
jgi:uncharacterized membrane protein (DUF106 family)